MSNDVIATLVIVPAVFAVWAVTITLLERRRK